MNLTKVLYLQTPKLTPNQFFISTSCCSLLFYLILLEPTTIVVSISTFVLSFIILKTFQLLAFQIFGRKIKLNTKVLFSIALAISLILTVFINPSLAQIFDGAESEIEGLTEGEGVGEFFSMLRVIILVGLAAGVIYAGVQAWRNSDVTPAAMGLAAGVLGLVIIEVFQRIILGA